MITDISPYAYFEELEERRWVEDFLHEERMQRLREKASEIEDVFPELLSDFNPNAPAYTQYMQDDIAQQLYANLIIELSEYHARKELEL